jgi:uncharacterized CHY-type Zn-finger protein
MPITFYRCYKCHREFDNFKAAKNCENAHLTPVSVKVVRYTIRQYPYSVEITFNNGERRIYNAEDSGG